MSAAALCLSERTRLVCHASHPHPVTRRERPGARCEQLLGYAPVAVRFDDVEARAPSDPDGRIWVRCSRCHTWNVFAVVAE